MRYKPGDQVVTIWVRGMQQKFVGQYAEVLGATTIEHCPGLTSYMLEFFADGSGSVCECAFRRARHHKAIVSWKEVVWKPRDIA